MSLHARNPTLIRIGRTLWTRQRLIFLVIGTLAFIAGLALRDIVLCVFGMLIAGSFAWDAVSGSPESAHVHMWQWLTKTKAHRR
jgi:hypothetical protein